MIGDAVILFLNMMSGLSTTSRRVVLFRNHFYAFRTVGSSHQIEDMRLCKLMAEKGESNMKCLLEYMLVSSLTICI